MRTLHHNNEIYYPATRHIFLEVEVRQELWSPEEPSNRLAGLWKVAVPLEQDDVDAGWTAMGAFFTVFETANLQAFDVYVYDEQMNPIELD